MIRFNLNSSSNRLLARRLGRLAFHAVPEDIGYYKIRAEELDEVLGPKRVESSKIEAAMRRIAQKLFLYDDAQRALLEQEISEDERQFVNGQSLRYLKEFVDTRDLAPRQLPTSQTRVAKALRQALQSNSPSMMQDVADILWNYPIHRRSTNQMVARELLRLGHGEAAKHVMESLLMATRKTSDTSSEKPLGVSSYTLCLELAMATNDHNWFMNLSQVCNAKSTSPLKLKFEPNMSSSSIELMLAEGFMKFGHPHLLDEVLTRNRLETFYVKLLAVSMELAARQNDASRALWTFEEFAKNFDPTKTTTVRFLLLARKHPSTRPKVSEYVTKLSATKKKLYKQKEPVWQYMHPYAN